ncbi:MAG: rhomboid family intramembrane serine protease [Candidatus Bathyarchaeota archaeon]|nr:rhomboid family intramembrane serine protease [Candidatus Bathyarchaeota archaeon]
MHSGSKKFMLTYIVIALNIIVYAYTAILSGNFPEIDDYVLRQYGQDNSFVLNGGYWQLFTAMFVHVNIIHLLGNMFFLLIFGLRAEEFFKIQEYLLVYLLSGLAGNLLTLLFGPSMVSAGASGAIFGLFGACTIYIRRAVGQSIIGALLYSFFLLMISAGQNVNNLAHLGGLVAGLLIGYALAERRKLRIIYEYNYSFPT